ncbi:hypothetical protein D3C74_466820 [compost metagenome]
MAVDSEKAAISVRLADVSSATAAFSDVPDVICCTVAEIFSNEEVVSPVARLSVRLAE